MRQLQGSSPFDYHLPRASIAQVPVERRDMSRLMVLERESSLVSHRVFCTLPDFLSCGDVLVLNRARVPLCRLIGRKDTGGRIEVLLLTPLTPPSGDPLPRGEGNSGGEAWECLLKPSSRVREGHELFFPPSLHARVGGRMSMGRWIVEFFPDTSVKDTCNRVGLPPLPPYIKREGDELHPWDTTRYQTVYADREGGVAAPTAGFHFSQELLGRIEEKGVCVSFLTLFPGTGSFSSRKGRGNGVCRVPPEFFEIDQECADRVLAAKQAGRKVMAVGTTTVRALESACSTHGTPGALSALKGETSLVIAPGFRFSVVDALVTNFHMPGSTHLMLVCAFAGRERTLDAYSLAVRSGYRFLSFGDAMLIL